ncbi:hypothetical protein [Acidiphilium acidophilum]|uniref:hypothetical protein n=1 Tax=Acidiphilium acidophilum TaxID=76588 RepID=UPI002E8E675D|nr:hypothetical protein [Acidiphilium acidophilum]
MSEKTIYKKINIAIFIIVVFFIYFGSSMLMNKILLQYGIINKDNINLHIELDALKTKLKTDLTVQVPPNNGVAQLRSTGNIYNTKSNGCSSGLIYYTIDGSTYIPEYPRTCKEFITMKTGLDGISAESRLLMDRHEGSIQIENVDNKIQWPTSKHHNMTTITIKNTGTVSVDVTSIRQILSNNKSNVMSNDFRFPLSFVIRPGKSIFVPIGSTSEVTVHTPRVRPLPGQGLWAANC